MATFYSIHAYDQESKYFRGEDRINDGKLYTTFEKACDMIERKIQSHIEFFNSGEENQVFQPPNREEMKKRMGGFKYVHYYETMAGWLWVIQKWDVEEEKKKETIREIPDLKEIARLLQGGIYNFKKVSVVEEAENCSYNVRYYPQDDDTITYFLSLILEKHRNDHVLLKLHKEANLNRYVIYMAVETSKKYLYKYFVEKEIRGTVVAVRCSLTYSSLDEMLDILEPKVVMIHLNMWARNWVPYNRRTIREYMERNKRMIYNRVDDDDEGTITYAIHKYET
jgi:hypothetical protein